MPKLTLNKATGPSLAGKGKPNFDTLLGAHPAVIPNYTDGLTLTGGLEESTQQELGAVGQAIAEAKRAQYDYFRASTSPDFYVLLCFQTPDQRDEFVTQAGWGEAGDRFLDGLEIAARLGVSIQPIPIEPRRLPKVPRLLREEVK
jgi:hypothetical protein